MPGRDLAAGLPSLRSPQLFPAWATRILVNECNDEARRRARLASAIRVLPTDGPPPRDDILAFIDRDALERAFRRLPADQRTVLVLLHFVGQARAEIAATLGIPAGTVRSRLHYAHRAMRAVLEADARIDLASGGSAR